MKNEIIDTHFVHRALRIFYTTLSGFLSFFHFMPLFSFRLFLLQNKIQLSFHIDFEFLDLFIQTGKRREENNNYIIIYDSESSKSLFYRKQGEREKERKRKNEQIIRNINEYNRIGSIAPSCCIDSKPPVRQSFSVMKNYKRRRKTNKDQEIYRVRHKHAHARTYTTEK